MFLLTLSWFLLSYQQPINICENIICMKYETKKESLFIDYVDNIKIRWYCRGCAWQRDMYDCSSFISNYLIDNWIVNRRLNTYVLANYGIKITEKDAVIWDDIVVYINKWTWSHHTAIYMWDWFIYDTYIKKTSFTKRYFWNKKDYDIYIIGNPKKYWFKKSFYKNYKPFIWKKK